MCLLLQEAEGPEEPERRCSRLQRKAAAPRSSTSSSRQQQIDPDRAIGGMWPHRNTAAWGVAAAHLLLLLVAFAGSAAECAVRCLSAMCMQQQLYLQQPLRCCCLLLLLLSDSCRACALRRCSWLQGGLRMVLQLVLRGGSLGRLVEQQQQQQQQTPGLLQRP